jgi:DNA invertase Pin-like site-specific DNA recombinase
MTEKHPQRVALYARVSTNAQHTENQLRRLQQVAALRGWSVVGEYVETVSGAAKTRPMFDKLMADARRRNFDTIAAVDVSRLGRSLSGLTALFEEVRQIGVDLYLDREAMDTSTPAGRAMLGLAGVFAAFERDLMIERTHAGLATARARGVRLGRPPVSDGILDAIRSLRAQGLGINAIARELRCGKDTVQRIATEMKEEATHASQ